MKKAVYSTILFLSAVASVLAYATLNLTSDVASESHEWECRRYQAIETQRALDNMRRTIHSMRSRMAAVEPEERAALEMQLRPIEDLLRRTQRQLLIDGASNPTTRRLIEETFPETPPI